MWSSSCQICASSGSAPTEALAPGSVRCLQIDFAQRPQSARSKLSELAWCVDASSTSPPATSINRRLNKNPERSWTRLGMSTRRAPNSPNRGGSTAATWVTRTRSCSSATCLTKARSRTFKSGNPATAVTTLSVTARPSHSSTFGPLTHGTTATTVRSPANTVVGRITPTQQRTTLANPSPDALHARRAMASSEQSTSVTLTIRVSTMPRGEAQLRVDARQLVYMCACQACLAFRGGTFDRFPSMLQRLKSIVKGHSYLGAAGVMRSARQAARWAMIRVRLGAGGASHSGGRPYKFRAPLHRAVCSPRPFGLLLQAIRGRLAKALHASRDTHSNGKRICHPNWDAPVCRRGEKGRCTSRPSAVTVQGCP